MVYFGWARPSGNTKYLQAVGQIPKVKTTHGAIINAQLREMATTSCSSDQLL